jgi:signal recognition particle subunit SRP72
MNNNIVCLNKDQNIFDSKKRLKAASAPELELKLNSHQLKTIAYNEILFSILTNQKDTVNKLLEQFKTKFGQDNNNLEFFALLRVSQLHREKKYSDAESFLRETLQKNPSASSLLKFFLIQLLLLQQNKSKEAIEAFRSLNEYKNFKLGVVSSLVTLLKSENDRNAISDLFSKAIEHFSKTRPNSRELEVYVRENSNYQISCNNLQKACEMLERMHTLYPKDVKILSKLINIYSKFDAERAEQLSKELPSLEDVLANSNLDIDNLEAQFSLLNSKYGKSKVLTAGGAQEAGAKSPKSPAKSTGGGGGGTEAEKTKKKKKTKIILPKNYNPNIPVDQERWLPLRERSYYKGKRKKKNAVGKGTQGAVSNVK